MLRYIVLAIALAFYGYSISHLLEQIKNENFAKSFLKLVDSDQNGLISVKQFSAFVPCDQYAPTQMNRILTSQGDSIYVSNVACELNQQLILKSVEPCIGDVSAFINPEHLANLQQEKVQEQMLLTYDLNRDQVINWAEYNIANLSLKKDIPYARQIFRFFDKNHNWKIHKNELQHVKVAKIATFILSGGKRRQ